jgi:DNA-binding transcriptional MerR regulator/methylmalonyl-CoA mutase cobalamin-binding subunit
MKRVSSEASQQMAAKVVPDVMANEKFFPISAVSEATGVPTVTLRAWERRYEFLVPHRTPKGHRLYSVDQIAMIRRVTALIDSGIPVSRVGDLLKGESQPFQDTPSSSGDNWQQLQDAMLEAVCEFNESRLDEIYEDVLSRFSDARVTEKLIIPLLHRLGVNWACGATGVAEEHFFSLYLRNKLGSRWHHGSYSRIGRRLVVACLPGDRHEYGLLFFSLVARSRGFDPIMLGADMPLGELPKVVNKTRAAAVVLSSTLEPGWQVVERDIKALCNNVDVPVFIGGSGIVAIEKALAAVGAVTVGAVLIDGVETIHRQLNGRL